MALLRLRPCLHHRRGVVKLTAAEIDYTRQVAAEIGADPDELIREGEAIKEAGYWQAYEAWAVQPDPEPSAIPGPEPEAGPVSVWETTESAPGGTPTTYITEVWSPAPDDGAIRIHSEMPDPEPLPDLEPEIEL